MLQQRLGSGDAGVLCDKVRKVAVAAFAAPAECVNEGIPFQTIFIRKSSCAVSKIYIFFQLCCGEGYYVDAFLWIFAAHHWNWVDSVGFKFTLVSAWICTCLSVLCTPHFYPWTLKFARIYCNFLKTDDDEIDLTALLINTDVTCYIKVHVVLIMCWKPCCLEVFGLF